MRRNVSLLAACQAFMFAANSVLIASAALVGAALADDIVYATVPVAVMFVFGMGFAMPASLLMKRIGRRAGFQVGSLAGIVGALTCAYAIQAHSFTLFCVGVGFIGMHNAFGSFYRFAAADVSSESYRSRAVSYVLAGSVIAAFVGPNMANLTKHLWADAVFSGSYLALSACYVGSLFLISFLQVPREDADEIRTPGRPLKEIAAQPLFVLALLSATVGYGVMNLLMTSTPLAMHARGMDFSQTAQVIQWHIVAMFLPSFFTGHLIARFGDLNVILAGCAALISSICVALFLGDSHVDFLMTLALLGIGWNFTFLGGTTLLTKTYRPSEKAKSQGFNDLCVFSVVSLTALLSGVLHHLSGWFILCAGAAIPVILVGASVLWLRATSGAAAARPD